MTSPNPQKKVVKAWAVVHSKARVEVYKSHRHAKAMTYSGDNDYGQIVPCTISYSLPTHKRKTKKK